MHRRPLSSLIVVFLLVASLGVSACSRSTERRGVSGGSSTSTPSAGATSSAEASGTLPGGAGAGLSDPSGSTTSGGAVKSGPLDSSEADALQRELEALERELESIDMPSDSDFQDIEGALE